MEELCLASHLWLPWVNTTAIQGILKNSAENAESEFKKQTYYRCPIYRFSNIPRESSTNLTLTALSADAPYFLTAYLSPLMSSS